MQANFLINQRVRVIHGTKTPEGVIVGFDDARTWFDVKLDGKKEVEHFLYLELEPLDCVVVSPGTIPTGDIGVGDIVQTPEGEIGFTQSLTHFVRWRVFIPKTATTRIFNEAVLTKMVVMPAPEPQPCTAIVPLGPLRHHDVLIRPQLDPEQLIVLLVLVQSMLVQYMMLAWFIHLKCKTLEWKLRQKNNKQDVLIIPAQSNSGLNTHEVYRKAIKSGRFTSDQLEQLGKASSLFALVNSQVKDVTL